METESCLLFIEELRETCSVQALNPKASSSACSEVGVDGGWKWKGCSPWPSTEMVVGGENVKEQIGSQAEPRPS